MAERIETARQWSEAIEFLGQLADQGRDGLGEGATVTPEEIIRGGAGEILLVRATLDDGQRMYLGAGVTYQAPPTDEELQEHYVSLIPQFVDRPQEIGMSITASTTAVLANQAVTKHLGIQIGTTLVLGATPELAEAPRVALPA
jgi:hypothetical protein